MEGEAESRLRALRRQIDDLDGRIVILINERAEMVRQIGRLKREKSLPIVDAEREEEILAQLRRNNKGPLSAEAMDEVYRTILSVSRSLQSERDER